MKKKFFMPGVFDSENYPEWPYYHPHEGTYLSEKGRICKEAKSALFTKRNDAVNFFDQWKSKGKNKEQYKLHIIECLIDVEESPYQKNHPMLQINASDLRQNYKNTALAYFYGWDQYASKSTLKKHRTLLLERSGFDIFEPLPKKWEPKKRTPDDTFSKVSLSIVK